MKIYIIHASSYNFKDELYKPLRESKLNEYHSLILPYDVSESPINSKQTIQETNMVIAEVSYPSTGEGIDLGWANIYEKRIVCVHKTGSRYSETLKFISTEFIEYSSSQDLVEKLTTLLGQ